jgi:hypothetical protein
MEHAEAVKLIKDYGFAVLKHQNNWLGEAYEALLRALLATPAPLSDEPVAFDKALKETYGMVDAFNPPPAGTYYRGQHDGIIAALKTIADNFKRHAAPTPSDKQEAVVYAVSDEAAMQWVERHDLENIIRDPGTARCAIDDARSLHLIDAPLATPSDKQEIAELRERIAELERDIALMQKLR